MMTDPFEGLERPSEEDLDRYDATLRELEAELPPVFVKALNAAADRIADLEAAAKVASDWHAKCVELWKAENEMDRERIAELEALCGQKDAAQMTVLAKLAEARSRIAELEKDFLQAIQSRDGCLHRIAELEALLRSEQNVCLELALQLKRRANVIDAALRGSDAALGDSLDDFNPNADGGAALGEKP